jgi:hypothetical protein
MQLESTPEHRKESVMKFLHSSLILALASVVSLSCGPSIYKQVYPTLADGKYDSEFPYRGCSRQLEEISESVRRISVLTSYKTYPFALSDSVRLSNITPQVLERAEETASFSHHSDAGTATTIYNEGGRIALLTCAHVVDFPDTIVSFYLSENRQPTAYIKNFSVRMSQLIFLNEVAGGVTLEILALDRAADLVFLGQKLDARQTLGVHAFTYPFGKAKQLEWGSFVYLFGYPSGYRMVTKGIVSSPNKDGKGSFVVDAVITPGASGSIALAIRDGVPNFELVGLVKLIPAQISYLLAPWTKGGEIQYESQELYQGDIYVQRQTDLEYGIVQIIPSETVLEVMRKNLGTLAEKGYDLRFLLEPKQTEKKPL